MDAVTIPIAPLGNLPVREEKEVSDQMVLPRISYIYNFCSDLKAIRQFYSECIGLPEGLYKPEYGCISYKMPGMEFMFWQTDDVPARPSGFAAQPGGGGGELPVTSWTVAVPEKEFAAAVSRLRKMGYESKAEQPVWLQDCYWAFVVRDPAGNTVELSTVPSTRPESTVWM